MNIINLIFVLSHLHIYKSKMKESKPCFYALKKEIITFYETEKYFALVNLKEKEFKSRWYPLRNQMTNF